MSLPAPNLDNRKFQDIVDDVRRQITRRCPEWTDHNISDPGITLIELFAWMMEGTPYRLNQVPERNYMKFLEMLGVTLESAPPARTQPCFRLSRTIPDAEAAEAFEQTLPAYRTVAATMRTDTEEAIEFSTETALTMVRPRLCACFAAQETTAAGQPPQLNALREMVIEMASTSPGQPPERIALPPPRDPDKEMASRRA